ncbi:D-erythronate dehydrogenase [Fodinicurvata sp. EGI_FJ10296]|uniref:D-erythronate dehydrogenase n=1 Tax=Fodinicurvata sp. EGI_FJ10296 TaxID=3231908 RepID=UPI0034536438
MHVLVIGAAGMVGRKLTDRLIGDGQLNGRKIDTLTLADVVASDRTAGGSGIDVRVRTGDMAGADATTDLVRDRPDVIFHLAAIVSGQAEQDFELGYRVNFDGVRNLVEAIRLAGDDYCPRLVFTSSIAVFGAPFPDPIPDTWYHTPLTSYGTQKAVGELLLSDYTRRGLLDGVGIRLPTIVVRPGAPNKAASGFFSGIIREPLQGTEAILPVDESVRHWVASPRSAVGFLIHAAGLDKATLGHPVSMTMPGLDITVGEMIATLEKVAGKKVVDRIRREPDPFIQSMVAGWPEAFDTRRALDLGFRSESRFEDIINIFIEDELQGRIA